MGFLKPANCGTNSSETTSNQLDNMPISQMTPLSGDGLNETARE